MKIIALVGMTGCGKTEVSKMIESDNFARIRFGDITDEYLKENKLELNEKYEKHAREFLREKHGMGAYAILNIARIDEALKLSNVVIDGLYSWEEYKVLKDNYGKDFVVIAVYSSPSTRYKRLEQRAVRPLHQDESKARDYAEVENIQKAGPIAMADITIVNEGNIEELKKNVKVLMGVLKEG